MKQIVNLLEKDEHPIVTVIRRNADDHYFVLPDGKGAYYVFDADIAMRYPKDPIEGITALNMLGEE